MEVYWVVMITRVRFCSEYISVLYRNQTVMAGGHPSWPAQWSMLLQLCPSVVHNPS